MKTFHLPDLGEGLPDAEIHEWFVKVGDVVTVDQPLVSMETAKAIVDVPAPYGGKITLLHGKVGDVIKTGAPLISFDGAEQREDTGTVVGELQSQTGVLKENIKIIKSKRTAVDVKAAPIVKALATRLGIDIAQLHGTGRDGMITAHDVKTAAEQAAIPEGFTPLKGSRRMMLVSMTHARDEICPVTVFDDADISTWTQGADYTARLVRAMVVASHTEPMLNASFDAPSQSYQVNAHVNIGIAMDTDEGLFVPVIHHAESLDLSAIRARVDTLKKNVRERSIAPADLHGSTITLSNFGVFAGRYATPIIVSPQLAILASGPKRMDPVVKHDQVCICPRIPLSLTFDHRAVTGGEATRFLRAVIHDLEKAE